MRAPGLAVGIVASTMVLAGCSQSQDADTTPAIDSGSVIVEARALLPSDIRERGVLTIGTDPQLAPLTYIAEDSEITGFDIQLMHLIAERLGVETEIEAVPFSDLLDAATQGEIDVVASAMFDTPQRRTRVDFVDYLAGGSQWLSRSGNDVNREDPCGRVVAVIGGTTQATEEMPRRSQECRDRGAPPVLSLDVSGGFDGAEAVLRGEADAFVTDAPVAEFVVGRSKDRLALVGSTYDENTYGFAVAPNQPGLKEAIDIALRSLIEDGNYQRLTGKWGVNNSSIAAVA